MTLSREQMLIEMGISPIWTLREPGMQIRVALEKPAQETTQMAKPITDKPIVLVTAPPTPAVAQMTPTPVTQTLARSARPTVAVDALNWSELASQVAACTACPLCEQRKQAVFGIGDRNPDWLFVGEGPGTEEDTQGEPFVGQAGQLLDNMLAALDIDRGNKVYIDNAVKCRPPGNRTPEAAEIAACAPYLARQIALLKPKIIVLLGKVAAHSVLHEDKTISAMRGRRFEYAGIPLVVTYHPAYLLRNLPDKAKAWEDLVFAHRLLRQQGSSELPF